MKILVGLLLGLCGSVLVRAFDSEAESEAVKVVTYGSTIKLEHVASNFRLHSHDVSYGTGSGQQSVTGFQDSGDANSYWIVKSAHESQTKLAGTIVQCGDTIRLQHLNTAKNLHSHEQRAPMNRDYEVSAYGDIMHGRWTDGDTGDNWVLECPTRSSAEWRRFENIRLHHVDTGAFLTCNDRLKFGDPIANQLQVSGGGWRNRNSLWKTNEGFYLAPPKARSG